MRAPHPIKLLKRIPFGRILRALGQIRHTPADIFRALVVVAVGGPLVVGGSAAAAFFFLPLPATVPPPQPGALAETSHVYAADGTLIANFHKAYNRELVKLSQMPKWLQDAAVASEDSRFFQHSGVDVRSIFRAMFADLRSGQTVEGGSTITQQYVKNAYVGSRRSLLRKIREALISSQIERSLSKKKILENYLNTIYLGKGAYGVEAASRTYFNKLASQLTLSESALLVGLIPAPVSLSPYDNPQGAEQRRLFVVDRMQRYGYVDAAAAQKAKAEKPALAKPKEEVFRFPYFVDAVHRYLSDRYGDAKVFDGGLEVYTTIDPKMQAAAEKAIKDALPKPSDPYASLVSIEPKTGYVKALVGGRDYNTEKFNLAIQGRRQPGSSFKPFVLTTAFENGIKRTATYDGPSTLCPKGWKPCPVHNYGNSGYGRISVETATIQSVNTVYAQLVLAVGPKKVVEVAKKMGIPGPSWLPGKTQIDAVPALALGSEEVTPFEMASAFATLARRGIYQDPKVVTKVLDTSGKVLESGPGEGRQVVRQDIADNVTAVLQKVITSGTGRRADIGRPAAGKTGTATEYWNAWFVGYTPDLATAVWMGYKDKNKPMLNVHGVRNVAGGTIPAAMWAAYMKAALKDVPPSEFANAKKITNPDDLNPQLPYIPSPSPSPSPSTSPEPSPSESPSPSPSPSPSESPTSPGPLPSLVPS